MMSLESSRNRIDQLVEKKVMTPPPVKVEALNHGIAVFQPKKIQANGGLEPILALKPNLVVTAAFGQILPKELLRDSKIWLYQCPRLTITGITWWRTDSLCRLSKARENRHYHYVYGGEA